MAKIKNFLKLEDLGYYEQEIIDELVLGKDWSGSGNAPYQILKKYPDLLDTVDLKDLLETMYQPDLLEIYPESYLEKETNTGIVDSDDFEFLEDAKAQFKFKVADLIAVWYQYKDIDKLLPYLNSDIGLIYAIRRQKLKLVKSFLERGATLANFNPTSPFGDSKSKFPEFKEMVDLLFKKLEEETVCRFLLNLFQYKINIDVRIGAFVAKILIDKGWERELDQALN